eukprot:TRINITY_DN43346_c0_g1_i1.p1 TRINITY_DN43346_c0_g1~~TRINITY_DN43346_c0_g1_i1.p1  ORF type:complete len:540 (+),score=57.77 TRINITY_DN43346_c0_g1_i1:134-1753(+)
MKIIRQLQGLLLRCEAQETVVPTEFVEQVDSARRKRVAGNLLIASIVALVFVIFVAIFGGVTTNAIVLTFRINQLFSTGFCLFCSAMSRKSEAFRRHLDIPVFALCAHFVLYNSLTYKRMQALCAPAFDNIELDLSAGSQASEEVDCMLATYLCLALTCHLQLLGVRASFALAFLLPMIWIVQAKTLGTVLPFIAQVSVTYTLICLISALGLRRTNDVLVISQWEMFGQGNQKQLRAMCGIMDYLCDCVVNINSACELLQDCPKLSALLFRTQPACKGSRLGELLTNDAEAQRFQARLLQAGESRQPGVILLSFCDGDNRHVQVHVYHACFENEQGQTCHTLGLVESQEFSVSEGLSASPNLAGLSGEFDGDSSSSSDCSSFSETPEMLSKVVASTTDAGMSMTISIDDMMVVQTSPALQEFVGTDYAATQPRLSQLLGSRAWRKFQPNLQRVAESVSSLERNFGSMQLKVPMKTRSQHWDIFRAERCKLTTIHMFENEQAPGHPTIMLADLDLGGLKQFLSRQISESSANLMAFKTSI